MPQHGGIVRTIPSKTRLEHLARVARVIKSPGGNALLAARSSICVEDAGWGSFRLIDAVSLQWYVPSVRSSTGEPRQ